MTSRASAADDAVSGRFTSTAVTGPSCSSPVGLCAEGTLSRGLEGTFTSTAASVSATVDTPTTGTAVVLSDIQIQTKSGTTPLQRRAGDADDGRRGSLERLAIVGGTGAYAGAIGYLQFVGTGSGASASGTHTGLASVP